VFRGRSPVNGCAYCIDMHTKDARLAGETEQRIYALSAWRETLFFSDRERAALEWTEAVTRVADTHVPDHIHERVSRCHSARPQARINHERWHRSQRSP
jgi:AhpD family alkylhydroperoxidase